MERFNKKFLSLQINGISLLNALFGRDFLLYYNNNKTFLNKNDSKLTFATEGILIHNGYIGRHIRNTSRCQCIRPT